MVSLDTTSQGFVKDTTLQWLVNGIPLQQVVARAIVHILLSHYTGPRVDLLSYRTSNTITNITLLSSLILLSINASLRLADLQVFIIGLRQDTFIVDV